MNEKTSIRRILAREMAVFVDIIANAYPGFKLVTPADKKKMQERLIKLSRDPTINYFGLYRGGMLFGGMATYDFTMNLFSNKTLVGGVGLVAVDLLHKKEKVCKELILYFINLYKRMDACMVALHPFRPDFYRKMGFGYGTKMNEYRIKPADLPRTSKDHVRSLARGARKAFKECNERYFLMHHGMFRRKKHEIDYFFEQPQAKTVVYEDGRRILGYLSFAFRRRDETNILQNDIVNRELVYENPRVLSELLTFLHSQADQIIQIVLPTQNEYFHFVPFDPRDGSDHIIPIIAHQTNTQGIGIMYRVIDVKRLFRILKKHDFSGQNFRLKVTLRDSFFPQNEGSILVRFKDGFASVYSTGIYDAEIKVDIADFSSLVMGTVEYGELYDYGLSDISNEKYVGTVGRIFRVEQKPICHTMF